MKQATFCLSLDTELLWGRHDINYEDFIERAQKTRHVIKQLIKLAKKHNIPITWAVVGGLLDESVNKKPKDLWYFPEIINELKKEDMFEIASHSYAHPDFSQISQKDATYDFNKFSKLEKKYNFTAKSFVYPRNKVKYKNLLVKNNFRTYRGNDSIGNKYIELLHLLIGYGRTSLISKEKGGLINIPATCYFLSSRGVRKYLPMYFRERQIKNGIKKAMKNKELFHLWFHPIDLADNTDNALCTIENIFAFLDKNRKNISLLTMKEISQNYE